MVNLIWLCMLILGFLAAAANGRVDIVTKAAMTAAQTGVELAFGLIGVMALWMGIMRIAEAAGLLRFVSLLVRPLTYRIFPGIPKDHPAIGAIVGNISANILGLGNAATPLGLKAMQELQKLNPEPARATDAMCTFLAINTACLTLVPTTVVALRASAGSAEPTSVIGTTVMSTFVTCCSALVLDAVFRKANRGATPHASRFGGGAARLSKGRHGRFHGIRVAVFGVGFLRGFRLRRR